MKPLMQSAITAIGLSVLCFLGFIAPLISPNHVWVYQNAGSPASVFLSALLNLALVSLVLTLLFLAAGKPGPVRVVIWSGVFFAVPLLLLEGGIQLGLWALPHWLSRSLLLVSFTGFCAYLVMWRPSFRPAFERVQHFAQTVLAFAGLGAVLVIGQSGWCFWQARNLQTLQPAHFSSLRISPTDSQPKPRIIWIILDELSYRQVYEGRFPSLQLPAFDQLARQSTLFTQVRPAAEFTEYAIPSLLTGLRVDRIRAGADGNLRAIHASLSGEWQPFHPEETIFQDALDRGYSTAVAGWYIPYCRILSTVLDRCRWTFGMDADNWMLAQASIRSNMAAPWLKLASLLKPVYYARLDARMAHAHVADYQWLVEESDKLLADDHASFILLHIAAPHPGGIYDRRTGAFTTHDSSYIDNLALADHYLAHVQRLLQERGEWDSSAVIVMGDHSWRTKLFWSSSSFWTPEDQAASHGGQFDDRPAYIVKLPHQTTPARIDAPFDAVNTRALLQAILSRRLQSPAELAAYAASLPEPQAQNSQPPQSR